MAASTAATSCRHVDPGNDPLRVEWHYPFAGCSIEPLATDGQRLYGGFSDGAVRALDVESGVVNWTTQVGGSVFDDVRVRGNMVLVQNGFGTVALAAATGDVLWTVTGTSEYPRGTIAFDDVGAVAIAGGQQRLVHGIRLQDGSVVWTLDVGEAGTSTVVAGQTAFVGTINRAVPPAEAFGHVIGIDLVTRTELWRVTAPKLTASSGFVSPLVVSSGVVFGNALSGRTYALDGGTGQELWHFDGDASLAGPVADAQFVYVPSMTGVLYALNRTNGSIAWSRDLQGGSLYTEPVLFDSTSILTKAGGSLVLLSRGDGSAIWSYLAGANHLCSAPVLVGGHIVVVAEDGIYSFRVNR